MTTYERKTKSSSSLCDDDLFVGTGLSGPLLHQFSLKIFEVDSGAQAPAPKKPPEGRVFSPLPKRPNKSLALLLQHRDQDHAKVPEQLTTVYESFISYTSKI